MALYGAVLPAGLLVASYVGVGLALDHVLHEQIDQALLTQAAIETVSLFDTPSGVPHLHLAASPLAERVRGFAAVGALYACDGELLLQYPDNVDVPRGLLPEGPPDRPELVDDDNGGDPRRVLLVTVRDPAGERYLLWLGLSLAAHEQTVASYYQIAGGLTLLTVLILLAVALGQSRGISRRVERLAGHMQRLRDGDFDAPPPGDEVGDALTDLRAAIAETTERLRASAESRDRFIADAAHELRTPLASLRAGIDVTLRRDREPEELREALEGARKEVDRLARLATALLDLAAARRTAFDLRRTDLVRVLDDAVDAARVLAESRDLLVELETPKEASALVAEDQVRQAVDNLLSNAIKHAPSGSRIDVVLARTDSSFRIVVRDRGPGVSPEERERIFEPFHRGPDAGEGAGIGLAIVREVARRHGGEARVEPADGGGARFVLDLPDAA
jgi:signal transduction histidine kinase